MNLIVGLGNPGSQYNFTRHNFGFLALDFYAKINNLNWEKAPKFDAIYLKNNDAILLKPQLFYNESGIPVQKFVNYYKIPLENILVLCDDFNLPFGTLRYRQKGSDGGNNGLKSITKYLKTSDYSRLRLGTGNDELRKKLGDTDFVLSKFTSNERGLLPDILKETVLKLTQITT